MTQGKINRQIENLITDFRSIRGNVERSIQQLNELIQPDLIEQIGRNFCQWADEFWDVKTGNQQRYISIVSLIDHYEEFLGVDNIGLLDFHRRLTAYVKYRNMTLLQDDQDYLRIELMKNPTIEKTIDTELTTLNGSGFIQFKLGYLEFELIKTAIQERIYALQDQYELQAEYVHPAVEYQLLLAKLDHF